MEHLIECLAYGEEAVSINFLSDLLLSTSVVVSPAVLTNTYSCPSANSLGEAAHTPFVDGSSR